MKEGKRKGRKEGMYVMKKHKNEKKDKLGTDEIAILIW